MVPPFTNGNNPVTPVVKGRPVQFVKVPEAGVPNIGATNVIPEGRVELMDGTPPAEVINTPLAELGSPAITLFADE